MKYCPDVFKGLYLRKASDTSVDVGFCCQSGGTTSTLENIEQTLWHKRQHWDKQTWPTDCNNCWKLERNQSESRRHSTIEWYKTNDIALDNATQLVSLDLNCDNVCNLACISCGPYFSSKWASEIKKHSWQDTLPQEKTARRIKFSDYLDVTHLQKVYFNGGEPLLSQDHVEVLELLKQQNRLAQCEISYNTNCTVIPDTQVVDLWAQAKLVRLYLSIDAVGSAFDFIRWPATWQQVTDFLHWVNALPINVIVDITCTVGIHNIFETSYLLTWQQTKLPTNKQGDPVSVNFQRIGAISHGGKLLSLSNVSEATHNNVKQYLEKNCPELSWLLPARSATGTDQWTQYLDELAVVRQLDWRQHLHQLAVNS